MGLEKQIAMVDPEGGPKGKAKPLFAKPQVVGDSAGGFYTVDPRDPSSAQLVVKGHGPVDSGRAGAARSGAQARRPGGEAPGAGRRHAGDVGASGPDEASKLGYAPGTVVQKSTTANTTSCPARAERHHCARRQWQSGSEIGGPAQELRLA